MIIILWTFFVSVPVFRMFYMLFYESCRNFPVSVSLHVVLGVILQRSNANFSYYNACL